MNGFKTQEKISRHIEKPRVERLKFKQKVDAIETRKEFIMEPKKFNRRKKPTQRFSNHHLQQTGDDFDVEW